MIASHTVVVSLQLLICRSSGVEATDAAAGSQVANYLTFHDSAGAPVQIRSAFLADVYLAPFL